MNDKPMDLPVADGATQRTKVGTRPKKANRAKRSGRAQKRARIQRNFPAVSFEEALIIPLAIQKIAAGQPIRRLRLFEQLGKAPDSGPSRQLITNSAKYGLTKGSYISEALELTELGILATSEDVSPYERLKARFQLGIESIPPFKALYERLKEGKLPAPAVMRDFLVQQGYKEDEVAECVDTFIVNAKFLGLLRTIAGAERLLPIEHVLEETPKRQAYGHPSFAISGTPRPKEGGNEGAAASDWSTTCFYITPIGADDSEERRHSDLFLNNIIEPALQEFDLKVVRADQIGKPGMITSQIIEYILKSKLVIADLSFHNPNVFYELCLRHVCRLPIVQIIRRGDRIPFDIDQFRTIPIDNSSIYTLLPQLETYKAEIATQVRQALENPDAADSPISVFYPGLIISHPQERKPLAQQSTLSIAKAAAAS
jgi:hypothetical protein